MPSSAETHPDDPRLALLALAEPVEADLTAHVAQCQQCQWELVGLRTVVALARSDLARAGVERSSNSTGVWTAIAQQLWPCVRP